MFRDLSYRVLIAELARMDAELDHDWPYEAREQLVAYRGQVEAEICLRWKLGEATFDETIEPW